MKASSIKATGLIAAATAVAAWIGCGSPPAPQPPTGLCHVDTPHPDAGASHDAGPPARRWGRPEEYFALLVSGYDPGSHRVSTPARDCTGGNVQWSPNEQSCSEHTDNGSPLPDRPLTDDDLITNRLDAHRKIVWIPVQRFDNGEAVGPVAVVMQTRDRVTVDCIGTLRAMPRRARLHIETVNGDAKVLVAEGDQCTNEADPTTCHRSVRLMRAHNQHFEPMNITRDRDGACIAPARFELTRVQNAMLANGWSRAFELTTTLTYGTTGVTVHENVVVKDSDPRLPAVPPRVFRRVDADRTLTLADSNLVTDQVSLWSRMLDERASVATTLDASVSDH